MVVDEFRKIITKMTIMANEKGDICMYIYINVFKVNN